MNPDFVTPPPGQLPPLQWPTERSDLHCAPDAYVARTVWNPLYGMPGWTRDLGRRFHRGCDIAACRVSPTGRTVGVMMTDPRTGEDVPFEGSAWMPSEQVFAIADGVIETVEPNPDAGILGCHMVLRHPAATPSAPDWRSLYAHLNPPGLAPGTRVAAGTPIGTIGQTSSSEDARKWMALIPHLHFEVFADSGAAYDPYRVLVRHLHP